MADYTKHLKSVIPTGDNGIAKGRLKIFQTAFERMNLQGTIILKI